MKKLTQWLIIFSLFTLLAACGEKESLYYKNIDNTQLQAMLDKNITLIDIRRAEEWKQTGTVAKSKTLTFFFKNGQVNPNFVPQFQQLISKKDQPAMLICRTGNRSRVASEYLAKSLGYTNIYNVDHGITGWIAEKREVVKSN